MKKIPMEENIGVNQSEVVNRKSGRSNQKEPAYKESYASKGHIGRLPNYKRDGKYMDVDRANRYLHFQEKRIDNALRIGEFNKAIYIGICLLKVSKSYQVQLFNRVKRTGYGEGPTTRVEETLFGAINKLRAWDLKLLINRFYIEKKNGKLRPIGSPNIESRMISKAFTDMVYAISERFRSPEQHGYMRNRGAGSAIRQCVELLKKGYDGFEFDLKSFFNTVEPFIYMRKLEELSKPLAKLIAIIVKNIEYRFSKLEPESELRPKAMRRNTLERTGVPQGLSLSPILSTGALEYYGRPENLVMYADDGIYFFKHNIHLFTSGMSKMEKAGIRMAPEKSGMIGEEFKFCGVTFNRKGKFCRLEEKTIYGDDPEFDKKIGELHIKKYEKKGGTGKVNQDSFITHRDLGLKLLEKIKIAFKTYGSGECYKGYRVFQGDMRIYDVLGSSSWSCNELLKMIKYKGYEFEKIKPFNFGVELYSEIYSYSPKLKGRYRKHYNNGVSPTKIDRTYFEIFQYHNLTLSRMKPIIDK